MMFIYLATTPKGAEEGIAQINYTNSIADRLDQFAKFQPTSQFRNDILAYWETANAQQVLDKIYADLHEYCLDGISSSWFKVPSDINPAELISHTLTMYV